MKLLKIIFGLILLIIGIVLTITIIGAVVGIPLILISLLLIVKGLLPKNILRKTVKLSFRVAFAFLTVFIVFSAITLAFDSGKDFWNNKVVVPVMEPFSEQCGFIETAQKEVCDCQGTMLRKDVENTTQFYCYGECEVCKCSQLNETTTEFDMVECE